MWFLGKKGTFLWGNYHFWVMNDHLWGPSVHVDKSFKKIQARVRPPPSWQCLYFASFRTGTPSLNWFQSLGKLISEFLKTECEELRHAITHTMSLLDVRIIRYSLYSISITRLCGQLITPIFIHWEISWQHITNWNFRNKVGLPIMSRENIIIGQLESILRLTCVWWFFFQA